MAKWIPCGGAFIEADVIRWVDTAWERRRNKSRPLGDRRVVAEVVREDAEGWVQLLVRECIVMKERGIRPVPMLPKGEAVRRKRRTLERGKPERLLWSDESARAAVASKFRGPVD